MVLNNVASGDPHTQAHNDERAVLNALTSYQLTLYTGDANAAPAGKVWSSHTNVNMPSGSLNDGILETQFYPSPGIIIQTFMEVGLPNQGHRWSRFYNGSSWGTWFSAGYELDTAWAALSLTGNNGMTAYTGYVPRYRRSSANSVYISGKVFLGSTLPPSGTVIASLPSGFRPAATPAMVAQDFVIWGGTAPASVRVFPNGDLQYISGGAVNTWLELSITYSAYGGS